MGSILLDMKLDGILTKDAVQSKFDEKYEEDKLLHQLDDKEQPTYSGSFCEYQGLTISDDTLSSHQDALDYLDQNGKKWEAAIAVKYRDDSGNSHWLLGGWVSS